MAKPRPVSVMSSPLIATPLMRRDRVLLWGVVFFELLVIGALCLSNDGSRNAFRIFGFWAASLLAIGGFADVLLVRHHRKFSRLFERYQKLLAPSQIDGERRLRKQLAQLNQELLNELHTDDLTGLHNRRSFDRFTQEYVHSPEFSHQPLSFVMMDLDHFKTVNDTYGHGAGDQLLRALAVLWRSKIRASDLLARVGGEEFCLVLPRTTLAQAGIIAEKIRAATAEQPIEILWDGQRFEVPITVSLGVATADEIGEESLGNLLNLADNALYEAKRSGRNRVVKHRYN